MTWHIDVSLLSPTLWIHSTVYLLGLYLCLTLCLRCLAWLKDAAPRFTAWLRVGPFWRAGKSKVLLPYVSFVCKSCSVSLLLVLSSLVPGASAPATQQSVPFALYEPIHESLQ